MRQYGGLTKEGKWMYGWYRLITDSHYQKYSVIYDDISYAPIEVIPETVGQFTGLKDKNDKNLDWWEGDIFEHPSGLCVIKWYKGGLYMHGAGGYCPVDMAAHWAVLPVKIGNIRQTSESSVIK